ncbi:MAG: hypothetical protein AB3N13_13100 [Arenibacterium sp.]
MTVRAMLTKQEVAFLIAGRIKSHECEPAVRHQAEWQAVRAVWDMAFDRGQCPPSNEALAAFQDGMREALLGCGVSGKTMADWLDSAASDTWGDGRTRHSALMELVGALDFGPDSACESLWKVVTFLEASDPKVTVGEISAAVCEANGSPRQAHIHMTS